jgi:transcriptional regulator with XRE-family HTH domain
MGRARDALKQVLDTYGISQNKLAVTMGISRANVGRWYHGIDPVLRILRRLRRGLSRRICMQLRILCGFILG